MYGIPWAVATSGAASSATSWTIRSGCQVSMIESRSSARGEDLGEEEVPLRVAHQLIEAGKPGRPLVPELFVGPGVEGVEPALARSTRVGLASGKRDRVSRCPRRDCERNQRLEMAGERSAREQHPERHHDVIFAVARPRTRPRLSSVTATLEEGHEQS
jgi:hypothetical protein